MGENVRVRNGMRDIGRVCERMLEYESVWERMVVHERVVDEISFK